MDHPMPADTPGPQKRPTPVSTEKLSPEKKTPKTLEVCQEDLPSNLRGHPLQRLTSTGTYVDTPREGIHPPKSQEVEHVDTFSSQPQESSTLIASAAQPQATPAPPTYATPAAPAPGLPAPVAAEPSQDNALLRMALEKIANLEKQLANTAPATPAAPAAPTSKATCGNTSAANLASAQSKQRSPDSRETGEEAEEDEEEGNGEKEGGDDMIVTPAGNSAFWIAFALLLL